MSFLPSSLVLANDGVGTNVLKNYSVASYLILPDTVSEEEKQRQEKNLEELVADSEAKEVASKLVLRDDPAVLGIWTERELSQQNELKGEVLGVKTNKQNIFILVLKQIDDFILGFWEKVIVLSKDLFR